MNDYKSRPQNQFGQIKKHRITGQPRFNSLNEILCTYCITYKQQSDYLAKNLIRKFYICYSCECLHRKERTKNINRLIGNIYNHQKARQDVLPYTFEMFSEWLQTTNFFDVYRSWVIHEFKKCYTPSVIRINSKNPYSLDNLRVTTTNLTRLACSHTRNRIVVQLDDSGKEIAKFTNARVAAKFLGYKTYSNIHSVCKGKKRKTAFGFKWKYV